MIAEAMNRQHRTEIGQIVSDWARKQAAPLVNGRVRFLLLPGGDDDRTNQELVPHCGTEVGIPSGAPRRLASRLRHDMTMAGGAAPVAQP